MDIVNYEEAHNARIRDRIRKRYKDQIRQFQALGFTEQFDMCEILFPLSALIFLPVLPYHMFYLRDVIGFGGFLRVKGYSPYFLHGDAYSYGVIEGRGVIYVTMFTNGTIIQTRSFTSPLVMDESKRKLIHQICASGDLSEAWMLHHNKIGQLVDKGFEPISLHTSTDMMLIQERIDEIRSGDDATLWPGAHRKKFEE